MRLQLFNHLKYGKLRKLHNCKSSETEKSKNTMLPWARDRKGVNLKFCNGTYDGDVVTLESGTDALGERTENDETHASALSLRTTNILSLIRPVHIDVE